MEKSLERSTVLVVDDCEYNRKILEVVLRKRYNVLISRTGRDALAMVQSEHPDLILLDICMPEMSGYDVCTALKKDDSTEHIPIIFVSAMIETDDETLGLDLGAVDYIKKPFSPKVVERRIEKHLSIANERNQVVKDLMNMSKQEELRKKLINFGFASE